MGWFGHNEEDEKLIKRLWAGGLRDPKDIAKHTAMSKEDVEAFIKSGKLK